MDAIIFNPSRQDRERLTYQRKMRELYDYRLFMLPAYFSKLHGVSPLAEDVRKILKEWGGLRCSRKKGGSVKLEEIKALSDDELEEVAVAFVPPGRYGYFPTDIAVAWELHRIACNWLFSKRRTYLAALELLCRDKEEGYVAWPDALVFLSAKNITRAFVFAMAQDAL